MKITYCINTFIGSDPDGELEEVQLPTVTFGMKSSPFLAIRTLLELAKQEQEEFPLAARSLQENLYIDDFLTSFTSVAGAKQNIQQMLGLTARGNFELKKWAASDARCLKDVPRENRLDDMSLELNLEKTDEVKVLGIVWNKNDDVLHYRVSVDESATLTKRVALSTVARIFDPLGLLAPSMIVGKMIIQQIWKLESRKDGPRDAKLEKILWDKPLPEDIAQQFSSWRSSLQKLQEIKVARWLGDESCAKKTLVGFSDASMKAYGCCIYLKTVGWGGTFVRLVAAKGNVTPVAGKVIAKKQRNVCRQSKWKKFLFLDLN